MSEPSKLRTGGGASPDGSYALSQEVPSSLADEGTTARLDNPVVVAMKKLQRGLAREAERLEIASDEAAMAVVKELRGDYS